VLDREAAPDLRSGAVPLVVNASMELSGLALEWRDVRAVASPADGGGGAAAVASFLAAALTEIYLCSTHFCSCQEILSGRRRRGRGGGPLG
jgi:hypothetical protein